LGPLLYADLALRGFAQRTDSRTFPVFGGFAGRVVSLSTPTRGVGSVFFGSYHSWGKKEK